MEITLQVYSNEQWKCYDVKGDIVHLKDYVQRIIACDEARNEHGVYHCFEVDPHDDLADHFRKFTPPEIIELDKIIHPSEYETCHHGLSLNGCYDPVNHWR